jgi:hypothetical protein
VNRDNLTGLTMGFAGWCSPNPNLERFYETGDPSHFKREGKSGAVV